MPGSIAVATVADSFPSLLCASVIESHSWVVEETRYRNGELQSNALVSTDRVAYSVTLKLRPTILATLRTFYEAHGTTVPFFFTGPDGIQHPVQFNSPWAETINVARGQVNLSLIEIS
jgi:phage-related protein